MCNSRILRVSGNMKGCKMFQNRPRRHSDIIKDHEELPGSFPDAPRCVSEIFRNSWFHGISWFHTLGPLDTAKWSSEGPGVCADAQCLQVNSKTIFLPRAFHFIKKWREALSSSSPGAPDCPKPPWQTSRFQVHFGHFNQSLQPVGVPSHMK